MVKLEDRDHWAYVEPAEANVYRCTWDLRLEKAASVPRPEAFAGR